VAATTTSAPLTTASALSIAHLAESFIVATGLNSRSENTEDTRVFLRQVACGNGRDRGCTGFGDVAAIEDGLGHASFRIQHHDYRLMRVQAAGGVRWTNGHEFCAERGKRGNVGGHGAEERAVAELEDGAHGLNHASGGKFNQGALHGVDQLGHAEVGADFVFVDESE
jgi:hypothetical protein